jgi:glycosyltransferase involved in cell wall biosynthesis
MLISVIMACYNAEEFLEEAICSVIGQTYEQWELLIVDDRSTDGSVRIAQQYALLDSRIVLLQSDAQSGAASVRNRGIAAAKGEWCAILDADDVFFPQKLSRQVEALSGTSRTLEVIGSGYVEIDESGIVGLRFLYEDNSARLKRDLRRRIKFPPHSSMLFRTEAVRRVGGYNPLLQRSEDYDLCLRLSESGEFGAVAEVLLAYRVHSASNSFSLSVAGFSQFEYAIAAQVCSLIRKHGHSDPSLGLDTENWLRLLFSVNAELTARSEVEYRAFKASARKALRLRPRARKDRIWSLLSMLRRPNFFIRIFVERTFGFDLATPCYNRWRKTS